MRLKDLLLSKQGRGTFFFKLYIRTNNTVLPVESSRRGSKKFILSSEKDTELFKDYLEYQITTMNYAKDATSVYVEAE